MEKGRDGSDVRDGTDKPRSPNLGSVSPTGNLVRGNRVVGSEPKKEKSVLKRLGLCFVLSLLLVVPPLIAVIGIEFNQ